MRKQRGITLIALTITIIVILILAGVTVATLTGDNGLLEKATVAKNKNEEAEVEEQIKLAYTEWQTAKYTGETKNAQEYMKDSLKVTLKDDNLEVTEESTGIYVITTGGKVYTFTVSEEKIEQDISVKRIKKSTEKEDSYVGCYADVDKDGTVDGVIFSDLLTGSIRDTQSYGGTIYGQEYNIPKIDLNDVKGYYISQEQFDGGLGKGIVISPKGTKGKNRFFVMQLDDFVTSAYVDEEDNNKSYPSYTSYIWYKNAYEKMNPLITSYDFGEGRENTRKMIEKWNAAGTSEGYKDATQDNQDIWKHIQEKYNKGWFIPSACEWAAFGNELTITTDKRSQYSLKNYYWSSSQISATHIRTIRFNGLNFANYASNKEFFVRLATTF